MFDERTRDRVTTVLERLKTQMATMAESQQEWMKLTASASAGNSRVTVLVNANGVIIETKFANDIGDLDYPEIAAAVTQAHQKAVVEVTRKAGELLEPFRAQVMSDAEVEELMPGLPDPLDPLSGLVQPSVAAPKSLTDDVAEADRSESRGVLRKSW